MMREISPEETDILYECLEDLGRHHNNVSVYFKGIYPTISSEEIVNVNIPTAVPLVYEFDDDFHVIRHYYLGDQEALKAKMEAVANQGKRA